MFRHFVLIRIKGKTERNEECVKVFGFFGGFLGVGNIKAAQTLFPDEGNGEHHNRYMGAVFYSSRKS